MLFNYVIQLRYSVMLFSCIISIMLISSLLDPARHNLSIILYS